MFVDECVRRTFTMLSPTEKDPNASPSAAILLWIVDKILFLVFPITSCLLSQVIFHHSWDLILK